VATEESVVVDSSSIGFSPEELSTQRDIETQFQAQDASISAMQSVYNALEAFILEMRNAPRQPFGNTINTSELNTLLDEYENWLWDFGETATLELLQGKLQDLKATVQSLCAEYFELQAQERQRVEQQLQEEALKAAAEKAANGEEDEDHDTRKLKKADRMRLVVKNKEEGTELFKGGNIRPAAARYQKALTHCAKFFDLSKEDEAEVTAIKLSLYCNLASCYIKLENWEQVQRNCDDALKLDPRCVKALFRRGSFYEHKKEWETALKDYQTCVTLNEGTEDKLVTKAIERVKKEIQKLKDKEKKMWGKAFS
jgi:tetratricopeptide (TPR) repeat protein